MGFKDFLKDALKTAGQTAAATFLPGAAGGIVTKLVGKALGVETEGKTTDQIGQEATAVLQQDPEAYLKLKTIDADLEKYRMDHDVQMEQIDLEKDRLAVADSANLREQAKAELQSEDPYIRRARPSWLYWLKWIYGLLYGAIPTLSVIFTGIAWLMGKAKGIDVVIPDVPADLHLLVGSLVLGYSYLRSVDKAGAKPPGAR